jgi:hypothetical protein
VPAPAPASDEHERLRAAYLRALERDELYAAAVALRRFRNPIFAAALDRGKSVPDAVADSDHLAIDLLGTPEGLTLIARTAGDFLGCFEREPGESEDAFRASVAQEHADAHERAIALLEGALVLLRAQGPERS